MKTYEWIDLVESKLLQSTDDNGKQWQIPTDPANGHYAEYLRYTAWVEAGNNPEDFWTQDDELIEPSEPKEEEETPQETKGES